MSGIFDAIQIAENEGTAERSVAPSEATEVLRRAERREASKWEAAAPSKQPGAINEFSQESSGLDSELQRVLTTEATSAESGLLLGDENSDVFSQFTTLQVSVAAQNRLISFTEADSPAAEAFRLLAVRLRDLRRSKPFPRLLITSTIPEEGKSMVAANLACTLASKDSQKVLLLDGDLRRPSLLQLFGLGDISGLSECLQGTQDVAESIYHLKGPDLWLLPAGASTGNALELLQSGTLPTLMAQLASWFDWIIIDSPPVLPLADASVWMRLTDGILLVTRQGATEKRPLQRGLEALDTTKVIGAVLNCAKGSAHNYYYDRYNGRKPSSATSTSAA